MDADDEALGQQAVRRELWARQQLKNDEVYQRWQDTGELPPDVALMVAEKLHDDALTPNYSPEERAEAKSTAAAGWDWLAEQGHSWPDAYDRRELDPGA